jgi:LysM repeat protein
MKRLLIILLLAPLLSIAQKKTLLVEGVYPNLYLNHTSVAKENYYSIGRLYNISPKEIAPFNKLELEKGLNLNQVIKIPLTAVNFSQTNDAEAGESLVPVYHTVKEKEGLYHIATTYNKLPVATLKQWNNIKGDAVGKGTKLIVGYLKVKTTLSAFSSQAKIVAPVAVAVAPAPTPVKEIVKPAEPLPVVKNPVKEKPVVAASAKENVPPVVIAEPVKKEPAPAVKNNTTTSSTTARSFNKAYFKPDYDKQTKQSSIILENGNAATFKSTSGWEDGKYYCLHNTATPGTIIKITSTTTGKSVYAKVLDVIPDIRQNNDLLIRISNAASEELGAGENKFDCTLEFSK